MIRIISWLQDIGYFSNLRKFSNRWIIQYKQISEIKHYIIFTCQEKTQIHNTTNSIKCQLNPNLNYTANTQITEAGKKLENNHNDCDDNYKYNITPKRAVDADNTVPGGHCPTTIIQTNNQSHQSDGHEYDLWGSPTHDDQAALFPPDLPPPNEDINVVSGDFMHIIYTQSLDMDVSY